MARAFWVEASELWVADASHVTWHGWPDGKPVHSVLAIPDSDDAVVILEHEAGPRSGHGRVRGWANLVRVGADGDIVWRAAAVGPQDSWIDVYWSTAGLFGNTWSGFLVKLDPDTGRELSRELVE
jgi:hypothetical protein